MGFKDEMQQFDEQWEEDASKPRGGARLPDGPHQVIVVESRIEHDEADDTYTWVTKLQNKDGAIRKWYNLDHEVGRSIAAQDAAMLGYEGRLSGLEDWLANEGPIGMVCEIRVKTKTGNERDFTDVYINRVLGKGKLEDFEGSGGSQTADNDFAGADDDIPF